MYWPCCAFKVLSGPIHKFSLNVDISCVDELITSVCNLRLFFVHGFSLFNTHVLKRKWRNQEELLDYYDNLKLNENIE